MKQFLKKYRHKCLFLGVGYGYGYTMFDSVIKRTGLGTPFINVSFSGLLWGYKDELPCVNHARPEHCPPPPGEEDIFADNGDDDDGWDFRRRKRSVAEADTASGRGRREAEAASGGAGQTPGELRDLDFASLEKPKAELVDCKCEWGLFRDRNVTLRKPLKVHHGVDDVSRKGWLEEFDGSRTLGWWEPGSECDAVAGQDSSTLPPWPDRTKPIQMFISLMCRSIRLDWEQDTEHAGLTSARFVPLPSALGSPTDPDPTRANPANQCYCREGFSCYKTGVLNMAPCKTRPDLPLGAPIALSYPHFYQADPSYLDAVEGLAPDKERHQFYVDVLPEFGFPLAIRPRFQLNAVIRRDTDVDIMSQFPDELILPFLWAEDGFSEPSEKMAAAISFGLRAPMLVGGAGGGALLGLGLLLATVGAVWLVRARPNQS